MVAFSDERERRGMSPLERAARALHEQALEHVAGVPWDELSDRVKERHMSDAAAVLQALREPSGRMVDAGRVIGTGTPHGMTETRERWRVMVDAALAET